MIFPYFQGSPGFQGVRGTPGESGTTGTRVSGAWSMGSNKYVFSTINACSSSSYKYYQHSMVAEKNLKYFVVTSYRTSLGIFIEVFLFEKLKEYMKSLTY